MGKQVVKSWSVVLAGRWNRSILTPSGILDLLFEEKSSEIQVQVPIDAIGPLRVMHKGLIVSPGDDRLLIETTEMTYDSLDRARQLGSQALAVLPRTPITAVGYNINFEVEVTADFLSSKLDNGLNNEGLKTVSKTSVRSVDWNDGRVNIRFTQEENTTLSINYEKQTTDYSIATEWLCKPIDLAEEFANQILKLCN